MTDQAKLTGSLGALSLSGLLQLLATEGRTGRVDVDAGDVAGSLWLDAGLLVHAVSRTGEAAREGEGALDDLVALGRGTFAFVAGAPSPGRSLHGATEQILMEAAVRQDHAGPSREGGPSPDAVPSFAPVPPGGATPRFTTLQWRVLASIDGRKSIGTIASEVGLPSATLSALLADLQAAGVIRIT